MHPSETPASNDDTARLLGEAMQALKHQQEAAATSVHIAQAVLRAFQQISRLSREIVEKLPNEEAQEYYATEMNRITRALAGVVEEFSPGLSGDAGVDLPEPAPAAPLPEEFFAWMHTMKTGRAVSAGEAVTIGRTLYAQTTAAERTVLVASWRKATRARASALFSLSSGVYRTEPR